MIEKMKKVTDDMTDICVRKNKDYGNSFDKSLDEDGLLVAKIRLKDKLSRFSTLIKNDAQVKDESIRDTLIDLANYSVLTIMWMDSVEEQRVSNLKRPETYELVEMGSDQTSGIVAGLHPSYMQEECKCSGLTHDSIICPVHPNKGDVKR